MTKPDKALLWAREQAKERYLASFISQPAICAEIDAGKHDNNLLDEAYAYRAGAAASAARIKALEEALRPLAHAALLQGEVLGLTTENVMTARALLKEADQ
jgi:hypothetical protein